MFKFHGVQKQLAGTLKGQVALRSQTHAPNSATTFSHAHQSFIRGNCYMQYTKNKKPAGVGQRV